MSSVTLNPLAVKDRVNIGRIVWERTQANISTFACTYAIIEQLGQSVTWDQVFTSIFIAHKMHDTDPCNTTSEFSREFGIQVHPSSEMLVLKTLDYTVPRAFFLSDMYTLGVSRNCSLDRMDIAARIAILYRMPDIDRNACIVACLAAASKWGGTLHVFLRHIPKFKERTSTTTVARFFARLLNARAKNE